MYMTTLTATKARTQLFKMLDRSILGHEAFEITSKKGKAVLLSEEDYEELLETLELLSTPGLLKSVRKADKEIAQGKVRAMEKVFKKYRA